MYMPSHTEECKYGRLVGAYCNGWEKKIKLQEEAICEILVTDTNSESNTLRKPLIVKQACNMSY
jgi:hypothetical protein